MANRPFRLAGLGATTGTSPLISLIAARITNFIESDSLREDFPWQFGDAVDCRYYQVTLARLTRNPEGRCLITLIDQTSELRTEHNLRREMMTDSLTGLANRAGFSDHLETLIDDTAQRARYAVLIVDLDRFSRVNACLGSMAGDELLITVARRLKGALRAHDVLARTGGDEFGILMTLEEGPGDADHLAKRIQNALSTPFRLSDFEIRVACSIGIAFGSSDVRRCRGTDPPRPVRGAALEDERPGRGLSDPGLRYRARAVRHGDGAAPRARPRPDAADLSADLRPRDRADRLLRIAGALGRRARHRIFAVRFHPGRRGIRPDRTARPLGDRGSGAHARLAGIARAGGHCGVKLAVNLSAIQLQRDIIAPVVERALSANGLDGSRFTLELTESALVSDPDRIAGIMHALKGLGTTLAMDDFGTGYSNLAYLQKLPIDILKIDRSFVTGMLADRDKIAIVRAILSLAQALGMQTTAEGIETNELAQTLAALGCTYGQGSSMRGRSRPTPPMRCWKPAGTEPPSRRRSASTRAASGKPSAIHCSSTRRSVFATSGPLRSPALDQRAAGERQGRACHPIREAASLSGRSESSSRSIARSVPVR